MDFKITDLNGNKIECFWQFDYGQIIKIQSDKIINEVHFSNVKSKYITKGVLTQTSGGYLCSIPNDLLKVAMPLFVFIYYRTNSSGTTVFKKTFPVRKKVADSESEEYELPSVILVTEGITVTDDGNGNVTISNEVDNNV